MADTKTEVMPSESHEREGAGYYIYGLVDPQSLYETDGDALLSIFYVGKGVQGRWEQHEKDARNALLREEIYLERRSSKAERIRRILDRGERVPAIRLSAGYVEEKDALRAESLAIDTVDAALRAAGRPPLVNVAPGYKAGFVWLREHFAFTETIDVEVEAARVETPYIVVKGTVDELSRPAKKRGTLPAAMDDKTGRVIAIENIADGEPGGFTIRGWDPFNPWSDQEARERASRYWPIATDRVERWIDNPDSMPQQIFLGIPVGDGRTAIRYAWGVDPTGSWQFYPQLRRWAIPIGERIYKHPWLGAVLYETRDGGRKQILAGFAAGIRVYEV